MLLAHQSKLQPNQTQIAARSRCLHLLRLQYNFRLGERIEAYEQVTQPKLGEYSDVLLVQLTGIKKSFSVSPVTIMPMPTFKLRLIF